MFGVAFGLVAKIFLCATLLYVVAILYVKIIIENLNTPGWFGTFCDYFNVFFGFVFGILILYSHLYYKIIGRLIAIPAIEDFEEYKKKEKTRVEKYYKDKERKILQQASEITRITEENEDLKNIIKEYEVEIKTIKNNAKKDQETVAKWIMVKNETMDALTSRIQELEKQLGIDSKFDPKKEERIRKRVMEKIHGKGTE